MLLLLWRRGSIIYHVAVGTRALIIAFCGLRPNGGGHSIWLFRSGASSSRVTMVSTRVKHWAATEIAFKPRALSMIVYHRQCTITDATPQFIDYFRVRCGRLELNFMPSSVSCVLYSTGDIGSFKPLAGDSRTGKDANNRYKAVRRVHVQAGVTGIVRLIAGRWLPLHSEAIKAYWRGAVTAIKKHTHLLAIAIFRCTLVLFILRTA